MCERGRVIMEFCFLDHQALGFKGKQQGVTYGHTTTSRTDLDLSLPPPSLPVQRLKGSSAEVLPTKKQKTLGSFFEKR